MAMEDNYEVQKSDKTLLNEWLRQMLNEAKYDFSE